MRRTSRRRQLEHLLSLADHRLLSLLVQQTLEGERLRIFGRSLESARREVAERLLSRARQQQALGWLVGNEADEFIPRVKWRLEELRGVGDSVLFHPHFETGRRFVEKTFRPDGHQICLFLPCHRVKPYALSPLIQKVESMLESSSANATVIWAVASVPGIVPAGFDRRYPFAYYNWDPARENAAIVSSYREALRRRAGRFISHTRSTFSTFAAYFRPRSPELTALQAAAEDHGAILETAPLAETVELVQEERVRWRFAGLKSPECLSDLRTLLEQHQETSHDG